MRERTNVLLEISWMALAIVGAAILLFGLVIAAVPPGNDAPLFRSIGVASIGMGLFGLLITVTAYRRREPWAWFALWYYPAFWITHFLAALPPGKDRIHQIVFIVLSLAGLLLPLRQFFRRGAGRAL